MDKIYSEETINKVLEDVLLIPKIENDTEYTIDEIIEEVSNNKIVLNEDIINNLQMIKDKNIDFSFLENDNIENKKKPKKKEKEISEEKKLLFPLNIKNPIQLVNYLEIESFQNKKEEKNEFLLQKYKKNSKFKIGLIQSEKNEQISQIVFSKTKNYEITVISVKDDYIIIGDIFGEVKYYSISDNREIRTLPCPFVSKIRKEVRCFDFSNDGDFLFVGYKNSNIAMFEVLQNKCKLLNESIHKKKNTEKENPLINIKCYKNIKKNSFYLFSSDTNGNLCDSTIKDRMLLYTVKETRKLLYQENKPVFLIKLINFNDNTKKSLPFLTNYKGGAIFGDSDSIRLFVIEPRIFEIWKFNVPNGLTNIDISDASFGIGKPLIKQINNITEKEKEKDNNDIFNKLTFNDYGNEEQKEKENNNKNNEITQNNEQQLQLIISFDRIIYIFEIPILYNQLTRPILLGYFINKNQIIKIGYLAESMIYIFDITQKLKIINSRKVNEGELKLSEDLKEIITPKENNLAILETEKELQSQIKCQYLSEGKNALKSYQNTIIEKKDTIYFFTEEYFYTNVLLKWDVCLNSLQKKSLWMDLLTIGIDIYQGKLTALADIPKDEKERKNVIGKYLQEIIQQFAFYNFGVKKNQSIDENEIISEAIDATIEFCIEIGCIDYLLKDVESVYEGKGYGQQFLSKLEPFILNNKIIDFNLSEEIIDKLINLYEEKNKLVTLAQLIIHLNVECIDNEKIKMKLEDNILLSTPLIYIYMNGKKKDFFTPVLKLFDWFKSAQSIENFTDYQSLNNTIQKLEEIEVKKQYLGHKILWYISWVYTGKIFPGKNSEYDSELLYKFIPKLLYWLMSEEVMKEFLEFDSKNYFRCIKRCFNDFNLYTIIKDFAFDEDEVLIEENNNEGKEILKNEKIKINDISPNSLLDYLVKCSNEFSFNDTQKLYLYELIAKASHYVKNLNVDLRNCAAEFILKHFSSIIKEVNQKRIYDLCKDINILIGKDDRKIDINLRKILNYINDDYFDEVKLFIYQRLDDYENVIQIFIKENSKIENNEARFFTWVNLTLTKFKNDENSFNHFESILLEKSNLIKIVKLSPEKLHLLILDFFKDKKREVVDKLYSEPDIQLKYVEYLVNYIKKTLNENEDILIDPEYDSYILGLHIELLCKEGRKKEVYQNLQNLKHYPSQKCLEICTNYKVIDASIYLNLIIGSVNDALKLSLNSLEENYNNIINNLQNKDFNENRYTLNLESFQDSLKSCYYVCEYTSDSIHKNENDEFKEIYNNEKNENEEEEEEIDEETKIKLIKERTEKLMKTPWFQFQNSLYQMCDNFHKETIKIKENNNLKRYYDETYKIILKSFKNLLEKMCNYISIKDLFDVVFEEYKNAEFKEFKNFLVKILSSNDNQQNILSSARRLLKNHIFLDLKELKEINISGNELNINKCDECGKNFIKDFKSREKILVFKCGHFTHENCSFQDLEGRICPICRRNELESSVGTSSLFNKTSNIVNKDDFEEDNSKIVDVDDITKKMIMKLKVMDQINYQSEKNLIDNMRSKYYD